MIRLTLMESTSVSSTPGGQGSTLLVFSAGKKDLVMISVN